MQEVSKVLKELRIGKGYKQYQVADMLGIDRGNYCKYENGKLEISLDLLRHLAMLYDVTTDYILGMDEYIKNNKNKIKNLQK